MRPTDRPEHGGVPAAGLRLFFAFGKGETTLTLKSAPGWETPTTERGRGRVFFF